MYALAMKRRSKIMSKGYVEFLKILEVKQSMCWIQNDDAELVGYTESIPVCSWFLTKHPLFPYFPKAPSAHTLLLSANGETLTKCFIHSHMLYLFIFQQKVAYWICIPGNFWNPFIRLAASFSHTFLSQEPTPANLSPGSLCKSNALGHSSQARKKPLGQVHMIVSNQPAPHITLQLLLEPNPLTMTPPKLLPPSAHTLCLLFVSLNS